MWRRSYYIRRGQMILGAGPGRFGVFTHTIRLALDDLGFRQNGIGTPPN
jgi:predicted nucleotide-binding protein (sugar kinase/HSP70/actin superfamily)